MYSGERVWRPGRWSALMLAGLLLTGSAGCGAIDPWDEIPISGKVTYEDGTVIDAERLQLEFEPHAKSEDKKIRARPGEAEVNLADGTFSEATTSVAGDGLIPGRHTVTVSLYSYKRKILILTPLEIVQITSFDARDNPTEMKVPPPDIEIGTGAVRFEFKVKRP